MPISRFFISAIFTLLITGFSTSAYSQKTFEDDFEGNGTITSWLGDDCNADPAFSNPFNNSNNPSAKVLKYEDVGGTYANVRFDASRNLRMGNNAVFSFMIYVPSASVTGSLPNQVSLKLQDANLPQPWVVQSEVVKPIVLDQWQTITVDFENDPYINAEPLSPPPAQRNDFNRVLIQVNGENNNESVTAYIDNFYYQDTSTASTQFTQLVWQDEFNGTGIIDTSKWFHQTELPLGGSWYNGEIQHYTDRLENSSLDNGALQLIAKKETFTDQGVTKQYTSARLNSKFAFTYGRIEVRAKMPYGVGTWPAIWTLGKNIIEPGAYYTLKGFGTKPWPACGEMDIMEHWGNNQNYVASATHTPSSAGNTVNKGGQTIPTVSDDFHIYELIWSDKELIFSVDGAVHFRYEPAQKDANTWPFDDEHYLLLNIAIEPSIDPNFTQDTMEVDYVRVYQEPRVSLTENAVKPIKLEAYPNPVNDQLSVKLPVATNKNNLPIQVYNPSGALVTEGKASVVEQNLNLENLGSLPTGFYVLQFSLAGDDYKVKFSKR